MIIYKFGGASVKEPSSFKTLKTIIQNHTSAEQMIVVISAMGKTTNKLERLVSAYFEQDSSTSNELYLDVYNYHLSTAHALFSQSTDSLNTIESLFTSLKYKLQKKPSSNYDFEYDQVVSYGELLSSTILSLYLNQNSITNHFLDARELIRTDNYYREASVEWTTTSSNIKHAINTVKNQIFVTQGFIGGTTEGLTTTLGREGSDFSAAIFAYALNATQVTIWKDVPGVLNADPLYFQDTKKIDYLSYHDAIELSYYGAKVIHPKTIKPLQNKEIPLYVKSFLNPAESGTKIAKVSSHTKIPSYIIKKNQLLLTISPRDFSFIAEQSLGEIFMLFAQYHIGINMMQNSALSFSVCFDTGRNFNDILLTLEESYIVKYNENVDLITIWHYNQQTIENLVSQKEILLEEKSRHTIQFLVR